MNETNNTAKKGNIFTRLFGGKGYWWKIILWILVIAVIRFAVIAVISANDSPSVPLPERQEIPRAWESDRQKELESIVNELENKSQSSDAAKGTNP